MSNEASIEEHPPAFGDAWHVSLADKADTIGVASKADIPATEAPFEPQVPPVPINSWETGAPSDACSLASALGERPHSTVASSRLSERGLGADDLLAELHREKALRRDSEAELTRFVDRLQRTTLAFMASIEQQVGAIRSQVEDESRARSRAVDDLVAEVAARRLMEASAREGAASTQVSELGGSSPLQTNGSHDFTRSSPSKSGRAHPQEVDVDLGLDLCLREEPRSSPVVLQQLQALKATVRVLEETSAETSSRLHAMTGTVAQLQADSERRATELEAVRRSADNALRAVRATASAVRPELMAVPTQQAAPATTPAAAVCMVARPAVVSQVAPCACSNGAVAAPPGVPALAACGEHTPPPSRNSARHTLSRTVSPARAASTSRVERRSELELQTSDQSATLTLVSGSTSVLTPFGFRDPANVASSWLRSVGHTPVKLASPVRQPALDELRDSITESQRTCSPKTLQHWQSLNAPSGATSLATPPGSGGAVAREDSSATQASEAKPAAAATTPSAQHVRMATPSAASAVAAVPLHTAAVAAAPTLLIQPAPMAVRMEPAVPLAFSAGPIAAVAAPIVSATMVASSMGVAGAASASATQASAAAGAVASAGTVGDDSRRRARSVGSQPVPTRCQVAQQARQLMRRSPSASGVTAAHMTSSVQRALTPPVPPLPLAQVRAATSIRSACEKTATPSSCTPAGGATPAATSAATEAPPVVFAAAAPSGPQVSSASASSSAAAGSGTSVGSVPRSGVATPAGSAQIPHPGPSVIPLSGQSPVFGAPGRGPASAASSLRRLSLSGGGGGSGGSSAACGGGAGSIGAIGSGAATQAAVGGTSGAGGGGPGACGGGAGSIGGVVVQTLTTGASKVTGTMTVTRSASAPTNLTRVPESGSTRLTYLRAAPAVTATSAAPNPAA